MTITPTFEITLNARVTPADALVPSGDRYRLGWLGKTIEIPAAANQVYTKEFTLTAATDYDLSLYSMLFEGAAAPVNADGVAFALTKIFALAFEFASASATVAGITISAAGAATGQDWTAYPTMRVDLANPGALAMIAANNAAGLAVVSGDNINIAAGAGSGTAVLRMIVIGYQV